MTWIKKLYYRIRSEIRYRKRVKDIKRRDPYVYK